MPEAKRLLLSRYSVAVLATLAAFLLRCLLAPLLGEDAPLLVFIMPVMVSAWYGGLKPGLFATVLSVLIGSYFFIRPFFSLNITAVGEVVRISIFLVEGALISWLSEGLKKAKQRTEAIASSLKESEEQYRLLVEGVEDYAIFMLDPNGHITTWNVGGERINGYKAAEILGRHYSVLFRAEDVERHNPEQELQIAATEGHFVGEGWRQRKDGSLFWASIVITALPDESGNLRGFSKVTRDISDRKRAEEESRKLLKDLSDVKFALDRAAILAVTDARGIITDVNDQFCQISQYSRQELIGQTHRLINSGYHPKEFFQNLWSTITRGQVWHGEINNKAKDGTFYWVYTTIVPFLDDQGKPLQYLAIRFDISDRKRTQEAINRSAERLEALHEIDRAILRAESAAEIARAALSRLRRVVPYEQVAIVLFKFETNEADLLAGGLDGEFAGATVPLSDLIPSEISLQQGVIRYVEDLATLEQPLSLQEHQLAEGKRSFLSISLIVEGELIGQLDLFARQVAAFTLEYQEIASEVANQLAVAIRQAQLREQLQTYAAQLEQRVVERTAALQEANEALEVFVYSVSHDLRAPLRAMQGFAQALLEDYADQLDAEGQNYTHYIGASAQEMSTLLQDLLDYSRLSRTDISLQAVDLASVVATGLSQLEAELQQKHAQVTVEQPLPDVMAHRATLVQVVTNLVANAIKFVPPGVQPQVRVWVQERGSQSLSEEGEGEDALPTTYNLQRTTPDNSVRLWVEDNGIGIEPKHQERIFNVFERLHGAETYPGTGIGLAIVRKGVERMGGRVGVESQLGQGSRFWIELRKAPDRLLPTDR
ncbi:MAG TPA: PAS domain S-box protein [Coleofasciculaceae cyanobacterium]